MNNTVFHGRGIEGLCNTLLTFSQYIHLSKKGVAWLYYLSHILTNVLLGNPRYRLGYVSITIHGTAG